MPGDAMLRSYLFEAAGVLLTRVPKWSSVKAWGVRLAKRNGLPQGQELRSRVSSRIILHRMWIDGTEFSHWSEEGELLPSSEGRLPSSCQTAGKTTSQPGRWRW